MLIFKKSSQNTLETTTIIRNANGEESHTNQIQIQLSDKCAILLILVEPGTFIMGNQDPSCKNDGTPHQVTLTKPFWMGCTPVTQEQWCSVMRTSPSRFSFGGNYPVEKVSWEDAQLFMDALNREFELPSGCEFSLPTEAQWEYAAQGGHKRVSYTLYSGSNNLDDVGWYGMDFYIGSTRPVATKQPNELGIFDFSGNVLEWCKDWYGIYEDDAIDPIGPLFGESRTLRGGCWCYNEEMCRISCRNNRIPSLRMPNFGFRLAIVPIP